MDHEEIMITAKPFDINVIKTHKLFYVLDYITGNIVELYRRTPAGDDPFTDAEVFTMQDGHLLVAINHPFKYSANSCLIAKQEDIEEVVNLVAWERLVDFYDTDIDNTDQGFFAFCDSQALFDPSVEWRCDNTLYGPHTFVREDGRIVPTINKIRAYETIMSVHGVGYLIYLHLHDDEEVREKYKNNSEVPCVGLTLSEAFKLLHEWSEVTKEPFNSTQDIAIKASQFLDVFGFTSDLVDNQRDMQVVNYLKGSEQARLRPTGVVPNKPELVEFVKKRMASSSVALLCSLYPGLFNFQEVLELEISELKAGIERFREYYGIPEDWEITETERIIKHCEIYIHDTVGPYVHNQLRLFRNKSLILEQLLKGNETEV
jgi:hypothetical protein